MMFKQEITNEEVNQLPLVQFTGEIAVIDDLETQDSAVDELLEYEVLGFDTETKPTFRKGVKRWVAIIQFATMEKAYIFRIFKSEIGDKLKYLLEREDIIKVGVALDDDLKGINELRSFSPGGFIALEKKVKEFGILSNGLRKLSGIILDRRISKSAQVSDWEAETLSEKQLIYAATDAWICLKMWMNLALSDR